MSCRSRIMHGPSASLHKTVAAWGARVSSRRARDLARPIGDAVGLKLFSLPEAATSEVSLFCNPEGHIYYYFWLGVTRWLHAIVNCVALCHVALGPAYRGKPA